MNERRLSIKGTVVQSRDASDGVGMNKSEQVGQSQ